MTFFRPGPATSPRRLSLIAENKQSPQTSRGPPLPPHWQWLSVTVNVIDGGSLKSSGIAGDVMSISAARHCGYCFFFSRTIRFMALSSEAAYWKWLCQDGDVNVKNVAVSMPVKIRCSRFWISTKVRLSLYQTTLFWFSRSRLSSLSMQADNIPASINYAARQGFASRGQTFASLAFFFFLMNSLSKHVSCRERERKKRTTKLSKWRPTKRSDTLILTVDFYSRMIWRRTRRAPAPVYD